MSNKPYSQYPPEALVLRDHLAIDRTFPANERTLLAYVRTALSFLIAGSALLKFFDGPIARNMGFAFLLPGVITGTVGSARFWKMRRRIRGPLSTSGERQESCLCNLNGTGSEQSFNP